MFSDEYVRTLKYMNGETMSDAMERVSVELPYLRCVKEIGACPELEVGDLLMRIGNEIWRGGYEYVVCRRRDDGKTIRFRIDHLDDCFEVEMVTESRIMWPNRDGGQQCQ